MAHVADATILEIFYELHDTICENKALCDHRIKTYLLSLIVEVMWEKITVSGVKTRLTVDLNQASY